MFLHVAAIGLALLTVILAGPASALLARARWVSRAPRAALVLWQAVGLGGGLGVLTAGLTLAAADIDSRWWPGLVAAPGQWRRLGWGGWFGIALTACVGLYLVAATITSTARVLATRRAHRHRLAMISRALPQPPSPPAKHDAPVRLLDHPHAVAYGLPGFRPQVVLTRGALETLTAAELDAVLAHEQAHARGRHDLVIQPFIAWARTFPFLPTARGAVNAVGQLVELLADDAALARCDRADLKSALGKLGGQHLDVTGHDNGVMLRQLASRITRLGDGGLVPLSRGATALVYVVAALVVVAPPITLLWS